MKPVLNRYEEYKESGIKWIGECPTHWVLKKFKHFLRINNGLDYKDVQSEEGYPVIGSGGQFAYAQSYLYDGEALLLGRKGTIDNPMFINGKFWPVDTMFYAIKHGEVNMKFLYYCAKRIPFSFYSTSTALPSMTQKEINNHKIVIPSYAEQSQIVTFLDSKIEKIDNAISQKENLIELLKERKQTLIQNAVTKGLNPKVRMKKSGTNWIGDIPEHWEIKRGKYVFTEIDERSEEGNEELLSVSHMTGVTPRSEKEVNMFLAESYIGSKVCRPGDLVYNIMWAWMGALGVAHQVGIVSPSYGVYRLFDKDTFNPSFLEYLLKTVPYIEYYNRISTGLHSSRLRFYSHMFMNMRIIIPPIKEQNQIVDFIKDESDRYNISISNNLSQIDRLKEYKSSLIDSAVTGKIKVE